MIHTFKCLSSFNSAIFFSFDHVYLIILIPSMSTHDQARLTFETLLLHSSEFQYANFSQQISKSNRHNVKTNQRLPTWFSIFKDQLSKQSAASLLK